jgi:hypothetical protein
VGKRLGCDGGAKDRREEVRLTPALVESKLELVRIELEMLGTDSMIGAPQPGLEVSEDRMCPRQAVFFVPTASSGVGRADRPDRSLCSNVHAVW